MSCQLPPLVSQPEQRSIVSCSSQHRSQSTSLPKIVLSNSQNQKPQPTLTLRKPALVQTAYGRHPTWTVDSVCSSTASTRAPSVVCSQAPSRTSSRGPSMRSSPAVSRCNSADDLDALISAALRQFECPSAPVEAPLCTSQVSHAHNVRPDSGGSKIPQCSLWKGKPVETANLQEPSIENVRKSATRPYLSTHSASVSLQRSTEFKRDDGFLADDEDADEYYHLDIPKFELWTDSVM